MPFSNQSIIFISNTNNLSRIRNISFLQTSWVTSTIQRLMMIPRSIRIWSKHRVIHTIFITQSSMSFHNFIFLISKLTRLTQNFLRNIHFSNIMNISSYHTMNSKLIITSHILAHSSTKIRNI